MWEKFKKHQDTVGFISAVCVLLYGLLMFMGLTASSRLDDILFVTIFPGWILYSLYKKNYFSRK
jgi:hypothetical protein